MAKVVKEHDVRKAEIIETAERLFLQNGYEETPVEMIIREIGIAKGTFYHYFRSKDQLLDILVDQLIVEVIDQIYELTNEEEPDAIIKLFKISRYFRTLAIGKERFSDYLHEEKNVHLHFKIEKKVTPPLIDCYTKLIEQGMSEGFFNVKYPTETAIAMLGAASGLAEGQHDHADRTKIDPQRYSAFMDIMERILGAKEGLFIEYASRLEEVK